MKRRISLVLALTMLLSFVLALTAGCADASPGTGGNPGQTGGQNPQGTTGGTAGAKKAADLMAAVHAAERTATPALPTAEMRQGYNRFAAALLKASADNKGNVMVSPASVFLALAMTLNGADGETKAAMLKTLAGQGITLDMINQTSRDWMTLLSKSGSKTTVAIANSIWFDQAFVPFTPFLQANADYFGAGARRLDFRDAAAPGLINAWVKEATKGTIDQIVDQIRADVVMYLINAVYFKSDWQTPFDKSSTYKQVFHAPDGDREVDFLHRTGQMGWLSLNGASGVLLPYENSQFAYFALLPDQGVTPREWLSRQDEAALFTSLAERMAHKENRAITLAMPKFESRYEDSLLDELTRLGMGVAFDPEQADFSLMNESHLKNLYIGDVRHKTFVRVDEKGTEAAAVTSVEMRTTSMPVSEQELTLDKPFLYGIMDVATGMPLFVGIMEKPAV